MTRKIFITLFILITLGFVWIYSIHKGYPSAGTLPKPIVIGSSIDSSQINSLGITEHATITNMGIRGNSLVVFNLYQGSAHFVRTRSINLEGNESKELTETFNEVRNSRNVRFRVDAIEQTDKPKAK